MRKGKKRNMFDWADETIYTGEKEEPDEFTEALIEAIYNLSKEKDKG